MDPNGVYVGGDEVRIYHLTDIRVMVIVGTKHETLNWPERVRQLFLG